jgi:hypothetical protein
MVVLGCERRRARATLHQLCPDRSTRRAATRPDLPAIIPRLVGRLYCMSTSLSFIVSIVLGMRGLFRQLMHVGVKSPCPWQSSTAKELQVCVTKLVTSPLATAIGSCGARPEIGTDRQLAPKSPGSRIDSLSQSHGLFQSTRLPVAQDRKLDK